jgi:hypothetical protein
MGVKLIEILLEKRTLQVINSLYLLENIIKNFIYIHT